jgi:hypothetical protein
MCFDQSTSHDVKKNWSKKINRAFLRKSEIWFHFNDWDLQRSQLNQSLQKFLYRYKVCLHLCLKEWRFFDNSRILENNQEQIQSNRSIFSNRRRKNAWNAFFKIVHFTRNHYETISIIHFCSKRTNRTIWRNNNS